MSCTLSDVITYVPYDSTNGTVDTPQDYLNQLLNLISRLRGGASRYVPLLMAKVAENLPNMSNPLEHMPRTLDAFIENSASSNSSPQEMQKPPVPRHPPPLQIQMPSAAQQSVYSSGRPLSSFGENVQTPQSQHTPHHERLMFETYSPSIASHTDNVLTPPIYGVSPHHYGSLNPMHHPQPRSLATQPGMIKQESWDSYHD